MKKWLVLIIIAIVLVLMYVFDKYPRKYVPTGKVTYLICGKECNCIGREFTYPTELHRYHLDYYGIFAIDMFPRCFGIPYPCKDVLCPPIPP